MQVQPFRKVSAMLLCCSLLFAGCHRPDEETPESKTDLITASPWKFSEAGIDQNNDGTIDIPLPDGTLEDCTTDNLVTFSEDSSGVVDEGPSKCDDADPQTVPFGWRFVEDETAIEFDQAVIPGLEGTADLIRLTDNQLSLSQSATVPGIPFKLTVVVVLVH